MSAAGQRLLGRHAATLRGADWLALWPAGEQRDAAAQALQAAAAGHCGRFVGSYIGQTLPTRWWDVLITPVADARGAYLLAVAREITAEKTAKQALARTDFLLREMSHRVGNGFQFVASMLRLQQGRVSDPAARKLLASAEHRVSAMALVHRRLYQIASDQKVPMVSYLGELCGDLHRMLIEGSTRQRIALEVDPALTIAHDRVVPIGILLTELVTNASKYAHSPDQEGTIAITLRHHGDRCLLTVADDGAGLPDDFDFQHPRGLGMVIVRTQIEQLEGVLRIEPASPGTSFPGTRFIVDFPLLNPAS